MPTDGGQTADCEIRIDYVLGSLEQLHGATPSERTFLGVIAMISSINVTMQIFRVIKLKKRLAQVTLANSAN